MARLRHAVALHGAWLVVAVLVTAGLGVVVVQQRPFLGLTLAGVGLLVGGLLRAVLDADRLGLLTNRSRATDSAVLALLGAALIVLSASLNTL